MAESIGDGLSKVNLDDQMDVEPRYERIDVESESDDDLDYSDNPISQAVDEMDLAALRIALADEKNMAFINQGIRLNGDTPIILACKRGNLEVVKALLQTNKVDLSARNNLGHTAIAIAALFGRVEILDYIFETHFKGDAELIGDLVDGGAEIGQTPLHLAVLGDRPKETVPFLLEWGAFAILGDTSDMCPYEYCRDDAIKELLKDYMCKQWAELAEQGITEGKPLMESSNKQAIKST